jgi:hypothetical protein
MYNLLLKVGVKEISEVLRDDDVEELQTSLSNQLQIVDQSKMQEMMKNRQNDQ